jgi:hypothetical protein
MTRIQLIGIAAMLIFAGNLCCNQQKGDAMNSQQSAQSITLPAPVKAGDVSVETALQTRRSVRSYAQEPPTLEDIAQLLWAAQGVTSHNRFRTAPSAGALYPLEVYIVSGNISGLEEGIYRYLSRQHELTLVHPGITEDNLQSPHSIRLVSGRRRLLLFSQAFPPGLQVNMDNGEFNI